MPGSFWRTASSPALLWFRNGRIAEISEGSTKVGEDFDGDYLIPGLVELHTDHLEAHYSPSPRA